MTRSQTKEPDAGLISTKQMRELHAALHEHGISGDASVHAYIARALEEFGAEPVESRSDLSTVHAAKIISDLHTDPPTVSSRMTPSKIRALRADFPPEAQGKLPRSTCKDCSNSQRKVCEKHRWVTGCTQCRGSHSDATMHIDFIGHADVTARLLEVDPEWYWEPWSPEQINALPPAYREGLWIWLHVLGVKRAGFGHAEGDRQKGGDAVKVAIGDALRNSGMRFGIALDLWAKGDRDWSAAAKADGYDNPPMDPAAPSEQTSDHAPRPSYVGPTTEELLASIDSYAQRMGLDYAEVTLPWRTAKGTAVNPDGSPVTLEQMEGAPPQYVAELEAAVAAQYETWKAAQPAESTP